MSTTHYGICQTVDDKGLNLYNDDGKITGMDSGWVQDIFQYMVQLFWRVGFQTNATETKSMIYVGNSNKIIL